MTAHKNSGNTIAGHWQSKAVFYSMLFMIISAYISRGALSVAIIVFLLTTILNKNIAGQLNAFTATPFLLFSSFLFFIPFLSGAWSDDLHKWSDVVRIKLPLLFFPIAFAGRWNLTQKQWLIVAGVFITLVAGGCVWGLVDYARNATAIEKSYLQAKTILTPFEDDHVRFSWLVSVTVILCVLLIHMVQHVKITAALLLLIVFFIIYLHVLSARTGILSLYIFLAMYAAWLLAKAKNKTRPAILLSLLLVLPLLAYVLLPTFRARIKYNVYDFSFVQKAEYLPGSSDGARTMSMKAGWQVLQQNPLGVGAGDVMMEADKWYAANVPQVLATDKFYPSSEWLMYGSFAGWPGIVLFTAVILVPFFFTPVKHKIFWIAFHAMAAFSFAFDMGLEVQYGVFLYAFTSCWWFKWLST